MKTIFRNATILTPTGEVRGDISVVDGKIEKIGDVGVGGRGGAGAVTGEGLGTGAGAGVQEHDCSGLHILPGVIDIHVHFRDPGATTKEDFASGSRAAAAGGITTVIDMPNTNPPTLTCEALEAKRAIAAEKSLVNYGFYMGLSADNLDEIRAAKNIAGVKVYIGSSTGDLLIQDLGVIEELFKLGKFVIVHAEEERIIRDNMKKYKDSDDPSIHSLIRSPSAAYESVKAVLHLAKKYNARVHITHMSTAGEVDELFKFRSDVISGDCTPHHLFLTQAAYADRANFVKINPPLRSNEDRQALWDGLRNGTIPVVATDHAPHSKKDKEQNYWKVPSGVPGIETMLPLLLDAVNHGELKLSDVVALVSENPARILRMHGKGRLEEGADADLTIVDMDREMKVGDRGFFSKSGWSPFEGWKLKGWPVITVVGGKMVYEDGSILGGGSATEVRFS